jgi:hypothetical protein
MFFYNFSSIIDESLSTSILEQEPLTWHYFETGSKRGGQLLVSSDGYTYYVKVTALYCNMNDF